MAEPPDQPPSGQPETPAPPIVSLRLLETTDLHGHIQGYDYAANAPSASVGLARLAGLIAQARAEVEASLLFDNGDFLQGTPMMQYWAQVRGLGPGEIHPMIAAMNAVGYDAATPGNHDFNFGLGFLRRALAGARFPLVCANAVRRAGATPAEDETLLPPWTILERELTDSHGARRKLRIGVIGCLPAQFVEWDRIHLEGQLEARGLLAAARAHLPALRAQKPDLVIALAHTGIAAALPLPELDCDSENLALPLARIEGIDVLLCGHNHLCFPGPDIAEGGGIDPVRGTLAGKPAMIPGRWGSHLGVMDLTLEEGPAGWRIRDFRTELRAISRRPAPGCPAAPLVAEDTGILALNAEAHRETLRYTKRAIGTLTAPLHSFFSQIAPDAALSLVAEAQAAHVRARLIGRPQAELPLLSAVSPFKCGGRGGPDHYLELPPGPLTIRHITDLYAFPNVVSALELTGAELRDWLERAAGMFRRITPGRADQQLLNLDFPCYNFDVIAGLTYEIDLTQPARFSPTDGRLRNGSARRIRDLRFQGAPLDPQARFILATNSYRSAGAGHFIRPQRPALNLGPAETSFDALITHLSATSPVPRTPPRPIWRFAPMPGTSVLFRTSPRAAPFLGEIDAYRHETLSLDTQGFLRIRLHL